MLRIWFSFSLMIAIQFACTNVDTEVFGELTSENLQFDEESLKGTLGAVYSSLTNAGDHNSYWSLQEISSDEIVLPQRGSEWFSDGWQLRVHRHEQTAHENIVRNAWQNLYGGISNVNRIIELLEELVVNGNLSQEQGTNIIAELKVLRAYLYWWLLDQYGNIPIIISFSSSEDSPPTVASAQVFAFIEEELNANVPLLTKSRDASTYGRFNYWAGKALQSRLYLNALIYKGSPMWSEAASAADEVINSGLYSLEENYFSNFNVSNENSTEHILVIPYDIDQNCCFSLAWMTLHYDSDKTFGLDAQPWNGYCTLEEFYNSYDDADLRKGKWGDQKTRGNFLAGPQFEADGITEIVDTSAEEADPDGPTLVFTPKINELFPNCFRQAGVRIGKYEFEAGTNGNMSNDFVLLRLAEILLNKAETELWQGSQSGLAMVNMIRERAGLDGFTELTKENLLAERGRELFYEGLRRTDLIRHGKWGEPWEFKPTSDPTKELMPIPQDAINNNPALIQNQGY